jgi:hypothetical protein
MALDAHALQEGRDARISILAGAMLRDRIR